MGLQGVIMKVGSKRKDEYAQWAVVQSVGQATGEAGGDYESRKQEER